MTGQAIETWKQRPEVGGLWGVWLTRTIALYLGRRLTRLLLLPITLYFLIRRGPERRASRAYLSRLRGRPASLLAIARHMHCFASTTVDRVYLLSERFRRFELHTHGLAELHQATDRGKGVLLFGSHLGSFEALRILSLYRPNTKVRVVLDVQHNAAITRMLNALNPELASTIIDASQDGVAIVLAIKEALEEGALVTMLADRARPGEARVRAMFLGELAEFPAAPWLIASALAAPVVFCFGLFRGSNRYDLHFDLQTEPVKIDRGQRQFALTQWVQRYAQRIEYYLRIAPYNWFNFYDFWKNTSGENHPAIADSSVRTTDRNDK